METYNVGLNFESKVLRRHTKLYNIRPIEIFSNTKYIPGWIWLTCLFLYQRFPIESMFLVFVLIYVSILVKAT